MVIITAAPFHKHHFRRGRVYLLKPSWASNSSKETFQSLSLGVLIAHSFELAVVSILYAVAFAA